MGCGLAMAYTCTWLRPCYWPQTLSFIDLDEREKAESGYQSSQSEGVRGERLNTPGTSGSVTPRSGTRTPINNEVKIVSF